MISGVAIHGHVKKQYLLYVSLPVPCGFFVMIYLPGSKSFYASPSILFSEIHKTLLGKPEGKAELRGDLGINNNNTKINLK
jgi:hypothetical protein